MKLAESVPTMADRLLRLSAGSARIGMRLILAGTILPLANCSQEKEPRIQNLKWDVARNSNKKSYNINADGEFEKDANGKYTFNIVLTDERGCRHEGALDSIRIGEKMYTKPGGITSYFSGVDLTRKVATAELSINFTPDDNSDFPSSTLFSDAKVVDPDVHPPKNPVHACADTPAERRAKERSNGGYSSPAQRMNGEAIATVINLNGLLCARVTNVRPLKVRDDVFEVTCIEYRGGTGTVRYIVNTETGIAFQQ